MFKLSIVAVLGLSMMVAMGCSTSSDPTQISVDTAQGAMDLSPIAPGVAQGVYAEQQVTYVSSKQGADWLLDSTQKEYNNLLNRYSLTRDSSLQPRLSHLQNVLQAASEHADSSFVITSSLVATTPPACSGGGSSCTCAAGCACISADNGCSCTCPQ